MAYISFEKNDHLARIILNHPPANILNIEMMREIGEALSSLYNAEEVKLIAFSSACRFFSGGIDMAEHEPNQVFQLLEMFHTIFLTIAELGKPTLAIVNGPALGGGCELATFCDIVIASETAIFGQPEIRFGVLPPIATILYPHLVGRKKAMELILTGDTIDAPEALRIGLINKVVPLDKLEITSNDLINRICAHSAPVLQLMKKSAIASEGLSFPDALQKVEDIYLNHLMALDDVQEGVRAFLEKRNPTWKNK
jgi:cyclohexa-1,5-dienecarbonyl-CoA hydratase